ncbi:hypothetical protein [Parablautia sp. Marseille-Q6255]|uniref:hypothetical protein n=1 Tax=Parablautia sp. Marseille-Q6255 TaxID=3039593 RepID=UPI0024BCDC4A|nr:hypothetical protein [Parablautia sp. Marseille-Q6255]
MDELKQKTSAELVDELVQLDRLRLQTARNISKYQAELQARGISIMEDRNKQYTRFYGSMGAAASVTDRKSLDILNPDRLKLCVSDAVWNKNVTVTTETKYKCSANFERMLKALFTDDYTFEMELEEFLESQMHILPDAKQKKLLLKKLSGDYEKDRKHLTAIFDTECDWDVELYYIHKIKNAELIRAYLPDDMIDATIRELKKCVIVDSKTAITLDYKEE